MSLTVAICALVLAAPPEERGVSLGLFSMDAAFRYEPLLDEIKAHGATHVSIAWVWWQDDLAANAIVPVGRWTATDAQIDATLAHAKKLGLHVTAFPILRLVHAKKDEWRGKIAPKDEGAWWASYTDFMLHAARHAKANGADRLSIGSELVSREKMRGRWLALIDRVRVEVPGLELMYSANWDHFRPVSFWDAVDVVGVTAYFELTRKPDASVEELAAAWAPVRDDLAGWSRAIGRRVVIAEVGCPSQDGAAIYPWDETRGAKVDLEEQRRFYESVRVAWSGAPFLAGVYFWNWFGAGGPEDNNYTPRNKPASAVIARWYGAR